MTTYRYTIELDETEMIVFEAALDLLIESCEKELKDNPRPPYFVWKDVAIQLRWGKSLKTEQMSGNSFSAGE